MTVTVDERLTVKVDGEVVAATVGRWSMFIEKKLLAVRRRTPDWWWEWALECQRAAIIGGMGGPCGDGVDFFCDDLDTAVPPEIRGELQEDAYDAAREAIVNGLHEHLQRMAPAVHALQALRETR